MATAQEVDKIIEEILSQSSTSSSRNQSIGSGDPVEDEKSVLCEIEQESISNKSLPPPPIDTFESRLHCLQAWYLRSSSMLKAKCLNFMMHKLADKSHVDLIVSTSNYFVDKLGNYTKTLPTTNYIYDKCLNDHNRSLEKHFREETLKSDLTWFENLNPERQIDVLVKLLELSGGAVITRFFELARKLKEQRQRRLKRKSQIGIDLSGTIAQDESYLRIGVNISDDEISSHKQEVEERAAALNDAFAKYRNQVLGISDKVSQKRAKNGKNLKSSKGSQKSSRSSKNSKKSNKSSKDSKRNKNSDKIERGKGKKGKVEGTLIDEIQLLPIWIVKQIFSYIDQKSLNKLRTVNNYWAYVIDDMAEERACRKRMDKIIKDMEANMPCVEVGSIDDQHLKDSERATDLQKRLIKLAERGAIHPKLRTTGIKVKEASLVERAAHNAEIKLQGADEGYETFPRNIPVNKNLAAGPSHVLTELGKRRFKPKKAICGNQCVNVNKKESEDSWRSDDACKPRQKACSIQFQC